MRHFETIKIPETTTRRELWTTCDICHLKIRNEDPYKRDDIRIEREVTESYTSGGSSEISSVDLCANCWENILIPFLKSQNCNINTKESYW